MILRSLLWITLSVFTCNSDAQKIFPFTTKDNRDTITTQLVTNINRAILLPLNRDTYGQITGAFWAMELMLYKPVNMQSVIVAYFNKLTKTPPSFQRSFLEMLYTLYPTQYAKEVEAVWQQLASPKVKAMALEYLKRAGKPATTISYPEDSLQLNYYSNEQHYTGLSEEELLNARLFRE